MTYRPSNHVTRELEAKLSASPKPESRPPEIPEPLMKWLEDNFKPRCRMPDEEWLDHERYAGKVELIASLRSEFELQKQFGADLDYEEDA